MEIIKRTITVHGGQEIYVLMPIVMNQSIACGHDNKGFSIIWANGSGYQFLAECFSIAAELKKNEILYLPTHFRGNDEFNQVFRGFECNFNIVCVNYSEAQVSSKDIERVLKVKTYSEEIINRYPEIYRSYPEVWKLYRRLTIKFHKKNMYISTNKNGFSMLSYGASNMAEYGDIHYNESLPHAHYDCDENTSKSIGVTFYHWHNK